jgi:putative membrane protein
LKDEAQKTLTQLNQANGTDFDRAYLDAQVEGHQKALDTLKTQLLPSAKAPELTRYLRALQPKIEQHLTRARALREGLASSSSTDSTRTASVRQETTSHSPAPNSANR